MLRAGAILRVLLKPERYHRKKIYGPYLKPRFVTVSFLKDIREIAVDWKKQIETEEPASIGVTTSSGMGGMASYGGDEDVGDLNHTLRRHFLRCVVARLEVVFLECSQGVLSCTLTLLCNTL